VGRLRSRLGGGVVGVPPGVVQVNQGDYNATTNGPDLDFSDSGAAAGILAGFSWEVTVGGLFFTEVVEPGDVLVANIDDPKLLGDWRRINKNIDTAGTAANTNFRIVFGVIQFWDIGINDWREVQFNNGVWESAPI